MSFASFVAEVLVKATLLLAAAAVTCALLRRAAPAARHAVWVAALAGVLALPLAVAAGPRWPVAVLPGAAAWPADAHPLGAPAAAAPRAGDGPRVDAAPAAAPVGARDDGTGAAARRSSVAVGPAWPRPTLPAALAAAWAAGVAACLLRLAAGRLALARLVRRARPLDHGAWPALLAEEARRAGVGGRVRLLGAAGVATPATWGALAPVVVMPPEAERWPVARRRIALRHELAHVARRDAQTQLLAGVACALYWFHPGVWLAARRLRVEREHACDDRVLASGLPAAEYAGQLLDIARVARAAGLPALITVSMARPSELEGRLLALLDERRVPGRLTPRAAAAGALAALALVTALSAFRPVPRPPAAARPNGAAAAAAAPAIDGATGASTRAATGAARAAGRAAERVAGRVAERAAERLAPLAVGGGRTDSVVTLAVAAEPGGALVLDLRTGGGVELVGTDAREITVRGRLGGSHWRDTRVSLERTSDGARLRAEYTGNADTYSSSHHFVVHVPRRHDVRFASAGGDIVLADVEGAITGHTGGGSIRVERATGRLALSTGGGEVRVSDSDLRGRVSTGAGRVHILRVRGGLVGASGYGDVTYAASDATLPRARGGSTRGDDRVADRADDRSDDRVADRDDGRLRSSGDAVDRPRATTTVRDRRSGTTTTSMRDEPRLARPEGWLRRRGDDAGPAWLHRSGGGIVLDDAPFGADLHTGGGEIRLGAGAGLVRATTGGGDIVIGPVDGSVDAHTGAGDVSIEITGAGDAEHAVAVTSGRGAVDLYLPADISARLVLESAYTERLGRRTAIESDWTLARSETEAFDDREGTPRRYVRGSATLGGGRSLIRVKTVNGDVRVHRVRAAGRR